MQQSRMWCRTCKAYVLANRPGTSHILHLLLSVLTLGLWLPVWVLLSIKVGGWRCQQCGRGSAGGMSAVVALAMIAVAVVASKAGGLW